MERARILWVMAACALAVGSIASADLIRGVDLEFVTMGHAGNAGDTRMDGYGNPVAIPYGCGAVGYEFRMGKHEITNAQWNAFVSLAGAPTGSDGGYSESSWWSDLQQPMTNVSWYEAAQFCNYLTSGNKLQGAYLFQNGYFTGIDRATAQAAYGTIYVIPTQDEWYKAAYFKADGGGYSTYANGTDIAPIAGTDSNYGGAVGYAWDVGTGTEEQNGTFDMMGNVWEWNETVVYDPDREARGGSGVSDATWLSSSYRNSLPPDLESSLVGFRVAEVVPEPMTLSLLAMGGLALRRRKA